MIIVSFFVCVPPLGWLGDIIIVFIIVIERVRCSVLVWVCLMFCEVGFDSPTKLVSGVSCLLVNPTLRPCTPRLGLD